MMSIIFNRVANKHTRKNPRTHGMELSGDILINAPREKVWTGLNDPAVLTRCIPGCEGLEATSPTERTARVAVKIGPVRARFVGHVRMEDIRPNEGCVLRFQGSGGTAGMAKGHSNIELADEAGGTRLSYTAQASIGGKLGLVGGRMIDAAAKQMVDQFFTAFNEQILGITAPEAATSGQSGTTTEGISIASVTFTAPATPTAPSSLTSNGEASRVLWFVLGVLSTGFGVWLGTLLGS
jgi:carbon monoxide dehydrogenase subunit G